MGVYIRPSEIHSVDNKNVWYYKDIMKKTILLVGLAVIIVILSILVFSGKSKDDTVGIADTRYKDARYVIENKQVTLVNGVNVVEAAPGSASKVTTRYFGNEAKGDFNGDGKEDVAFLLTQDTGGSGTFYYVVAAIATASGYQGTNAIILGDRIAPQTTEFRDGKIIVNFADRLPSEPMTAKPSVGVSKYYKVVDGQLGEVQAL